MGVAEILAALAALPKIVDAIKGVGDQIEKLQNAMTEKNIETLKSEVNESLTQLASAKSKDERQRIITELNKRLSK